jgi:WD40 repeat protein
LAVEALRLAREAEERAPSLAEAVLAYTIAPLRARAWGAAPTPGLLALSRDGEHAAAAAEDGGLWLRPASGEAAMLGRVDGTVTALAASEDGHLLLTGNDAGDVLLWELGRDADSAIMLDSHASSISAAEVSPDRRWAAVGTRTGQVWLSNLNDPEDRSGRRLPAVRGDAIGIVAFTPDARWLAAGDDSGRLLLWALEDEGALAPIELSGPESGVALIAASPDSSRILAGYQDGSVAIWDLAASMEQPAASLRLHSSAVTALRVSADSRWAASGSLDGSVRLFALDSSVPPARLVHGDAITSLLVASDGSWLATGGDDGAVRLWDLTRINAPPRIIPAHSRAVQALAASSDGRWLTTLGQDGLRVWPVRGEDFVRLACRSARRNLTATEWQRWLPGEPYHLSCDEAEFG